MRALERNKQTFHYATYIGKNQITDAQGYYTGETQNEYSLWKEYRANISAAKGENVAELFGNSEEYDKVIVTDNMECEIDENTILAIDIPVENPETETQTAPEYDYVVKKVAKSLNSISYAVTKVKVDD